MTESNRVEAVLTVQHNKRMYVLGTASVDPKVLKQIEAEIPEGLTLKEVIACNFTYDNIKE